MYERATFVEQFDRSEKELVPSSSSQDDFSQKSQLEALSSVDLQVSQTSVQDLMLQAYQAIGDPDGVYGCGAGRLVNSTAR